MDQKYFDLLSPQIILQFLEMSHDKSFEGHLSPFPSYVNRVYGLGDDEGGEWVVKFYRPGRWSLEAIEEEHQFLEDLHLADIPVVLPQKDSEGFSLSLGTLDHGGQEVDFPFALFPKKSGRLFESHSQEGWTRMGELVSRIHNVGQQREAHHRLEWSPAVIGEYFTELITEVPGTQRAELENLGNRILDAIDPLFQDVEFLRVHGDLHRANILERPGEGLMIIDFDDMVFGPKIQDLWLLMPDHLHQCPEVAHWLRQGYETFGELSLRDFDLVEPLRFMRMMHFNHWVSRQKSDRSFHKHFGEWGSEAYWIQELEDWRMQWEMIQRWMDIRDTFF
jgi:Ser/Thr protein kinase RdoA (MazF antagonist)